MSKRSASQKHQNDRRRTFAMSRIEKLERLEKAEKANGKKSVCLFIRDEITKRQAAMLRQDIKNE